MLDKTKTFLGQIICPHVWYFDGVDEAHKESYWYWHLERCAACDKHREVLNDSYDACGYIQ